MTLLEGSGKFSYLFYFAFIGNGKYLLIPQSSMLGSDCLESCVDKDCEAIRRYSKKVINVYQINYQNQSWVRRGEQLHF